VITKELPQKWLYDNVIHLITKITGGKGVSAAIIVECEGSWSGSAGYSEFIKPVTNDMVFNIGSVGKNFLAVLILKLHEEGILSLDDLVSKWLHKHQNIDSNITIRQLLNHTSGIYDWVEHPNSPFMIPYDSIRYNRWWTKDEIFEMIKEPYFNPGQGWKYSTSNYNLLQLVSEKATGKSVNEEITNRFIKPLRLNNTYIFDSLFLLKEDFEVAHGWFDINENNKLEDISSKPKTWIISLSPAMIFASATDLAKWTHALYNGMLLSQESQLQMLDFYSPTHGDPLISGFGLGTADFSHSSIKSLTAYGHLGYHYGYMMAMIYLPDLKASMVIMINSNNQTFISLITVGLWWVLKITKSTSFLLITIILILLIISIIFSVPILLIYVIRIKFYRKFYIEM